MKKTLNDIVQETIESLIAKDYKKTTIKGYRRRFNELQSLAKTMNISEPTEELFQEYVSDNTSYISGKYSACKERYKIRTVNLIRSVIKTGEADTSRKNGKSASDRVISETSKKELEEFVNTLKKEGLADNTICSYKRIAAYLLIYCAEKGYDHVGDLHPGDISRFIIYLYDHGYFRPTTISSALSGLRRFLKRYPDKKRLLMELPSRLPRERKILEIYNNDETKSIKAVLSESVLSKRNTAISLLALETGLRGVDTCNIKLSDLDWEKDIVHIKQQKTGRQIHIPIKGSYGNAIVDYLLYERPECIDSHLFIRELAPYTKLSEAAVYEILKKMDKAAGIITGKKSSGTRKTRHNAASRMLKAGVPMSDISAVLGHTDPNVVMVYLSTDESMMASCTLPLPGGGIIE